MSRVLNIEELLSQIYPSKDLKNPISKSSEKDKRPSLKESPQKSGKDQSPEQEPDLRDLSPANSGANDNNEL